MKRFPVYAFAIVLMAISLAACTKDECVEPKQPSGEGETRTMMIGDDGALPIASMDAQRQCDPQATLRSSGDTGNPGDDEGTGISDDGDDTNDTEKSNRKGN
jgi:hypothetical protein